MRAVVCIVGLACLVGCSLARLVALRDPVLLLFRDQHGEFSTLQWYPLGPRLSGERGGGMPVEGAVMQAQWVGRGKRAVSLVQRDPWPRTGRSSSDLVLFDLERGERRTLLDGIEKPLRFDISQTEGLLALPSATSETIAVRIYDTEHWGMVTSTVIRGLPRTERDKKTHESWGWNQIDLSWVEKWKKLLIAHSSGKAWLFDPKSGALSQTAVVPDWKRPLDVSPTDDRYVTVTWLYSEPCYENQGRLVIGTIGQPEVDVLWTMPRGGSLSSVSWAPDGRGIFLAEWYVIIFPTRRYHYFDLEKMKLRRRLAAHHGDLEDVMSLPRAHLPIRTHVARRD